MRMFKPLAEVTAILMNDDEERGVGTDEEAVGLVVVSVKVLAGIGSTGKGMVDVPACNPGMNPPLCMLSSPSSPGASVTLSATSKFAASHFSHSACDNWQNLVVQI